MISSTISSKSITTLFTRKHQQHKSSSREASLFQFLKRRRLARMPRVRLPPRPTGNCLIWLKQATTGANAVHIYTEFYTYTYIHYTVYIHAQHTHTQRHSFIKARTYTQTRRHTYTQTRTSKHWRHSCAIENIYSHTYVYTQRHADVNEILLMCTKAMTTHKYHYPGRPENPGQMQTCSTSYVQIDTAAHLI